MDPFMIPASLSFFSRFSPIFYTSRESKYYQNSGWRKHFYGGYFFKAWGSYPVKAGLSDYEKSLHHHIRILNDGGNLCYFPEGHITPDGNIQKAHGGIAYLAEYCGRPIVPVAIVGLYKISMEDLFSRRRKVAISFGLPIYQKELREEVARKTVPGQHVYKEEAEYVMKKVGKMLVEVCYFH
jgi:1-acyl-sn-glycerol-3-phosphate acyltransferase